VCSKSKEAAGRNRGGQAPEGTRGCVRCRREDNNGAGRTVGCDVSDAPGGRGFRAGCEAGPVLGVLSLFAWWLQDSKQQQAARQSIEDGDEDGGDGVLGGWWCFPGMGDGHISNGGRKS